MLHRSKVFFGGLFAVLLAASLTAQQAASSSSSEATRSKLDTVIELPVPMPLPVPNCVVPLMAPNIAVAIGMPAGVESVPEACRKSDSAGKPNVQRETMTFTGMTGREAIARLIELDPRYYAVETDGVLVVRPVAAWSDKEHFLHQPVPAVHVDAANISVALRSVFRLWSKFRYADDDVPGRIGQPGRTAQGQQPISFDMKASAYETLNIIARVHGALVWRIVYCSAPARAEFAALTFETFDGSGSGNGPDATGDVNCRAWTQPFGLFIHR